MPRRPNESWESYAERLIRQGQQAGEFDHLPGFGKPLEGLDDDDELAWVKEKLRREQLSILPPGLQIRVDVERGLQQLDALSNESAVRRALAELNQKIRQAMFDSSMVGPPSTTMELDVDTEVQSWRRRNF